MTDSQVKAKKKFKIRPLWVILPILILLLAFWIFRGGSSPSSGTSVRETRLEKGSLTVTVVGTGHLGYGDEHTLDLPSGILVDTIHVEKNERVNKGDIIVSFDPLSVRLAIDARRSEIDRLDLAIRQAASVDDDFLWRAPVAGRVKAIYTEKGDRAADVYERDGALILLSLDGKMAVNFDSEQKLSLDEELRVLLEDGSVKTGTVREQRGTTYTVTLTDNGPNIGEQVQIETQDKAWLAEGTLLIHRPLSLFVLEGKVKTIHVKENEKIDAGRALLTLEHRGTGASYDKLFADREALKSELDELLALSKTNAITAPEDAFVIDIGLTEGEMTGEVPLMAADMRPSEERPAFRFASQTSYALSIDIDELDILSVKEGQSVSLSFDAIDKTTYQGSIVEVSDVALEMGGMARYRARVDVPAAEAMRIGMSATATVMVDEKVDIPMLPVIALQESGGRVFVYTEKNEKTGELSGETELSTGLSDGDRVEITAGLDEGSIVYYPVASQDTLFPFGPPGHRGNRETEASAEANDA